MARIGAMILHARHRKGWSQAELAAKIGKYAPQISNWENDKTTPNEHDSDLLEKALGCSLKDTAIGDKIYDARSRKGWSQAELAARIGKHAPQISNWENDKATPNEYDLALLEEALDCSLQDIAQQIQDCLDNFPVTALGIAKEAGVSPPTIYNIRDGKVANPRKPTADRIQRALATLRERYADYADYADDAAEWHDSDDLKEEYEPEPRKFLLDGGLGRNGNTGEIIRSYRLFDPHDEDHVRALPEMPGVYLLYAGNNDVAIPSKAISADDVDEVGTIDRFRIVGIPEYVGVANNIRQRIRQWKSDYETDKPRAWWFRKGWINLAVYVETDMAVRYELETTLITLLGPQINKKKAWLALET